MVKKTTKSKSKLTAKKGIKCSNFCHPSTWLIVILSLALLAVCGISAYGFTKLEVQSELDSAKNAVFDHLISSYVQDLEINTEKPSVNEVTGYGISDEDGVFYVTFDFAYYYGIDNTPQYSDLKHGILYFWPDTKNNTYSHAFSYHDDYYHPGGVYTEIGDHHLRDGIKQ